jgi:hypothetical protein
MSHLCLWWSLLGAVCAWRCAGRWSSVLVGSGGLAGASQGVTGCVCVGGGPMQGQEAAGTYCGA